MSHRLTIWGFRHLYLNLCRVDSPLEGLACESIGRPVILRLVSDGPSTERLDERVTIALLSTWVLSNFLVSPELPCATIEAPSKGSDHLADFLVTAHTVGRLSHLLPRLKLLLVCARSSVWFPLLLSSFSVMHELRVMHAS